VFGPKQYGPSEESLGGLAYLTFVPAALILFCPPFRKSSYVRFHAWQSIALNGTTVILSYALAIAMIHEGLVCLCLTWLLWCVASLLCFWCGTRALYHRNVRLPILGAWAERRANNEQPGQRAFSSRKGPVSAAHAQGNTGVR
jgi:uncharacterized membrane protein